jgi:hypothetical protein
MKTVITNYSSLTAQTFAENYELLVHGIFARHHEYAKFAAYFIENYPESSGKLWATFRRVGSQLTCNMYLESYHRFRFAHTYVFLLQSAEKEISQSPSQPTRRTSHQYFAERCRSVL